MICTQLQEDVDVVPILEKHLEADDPWVRQRPVNLDLCLQLRTYEVAGGEISLAGVRVYNRNIFTAQCTKCIISVMGYPHVSPLRTVRRRLVSSQLTNPRLSI